MNGDITVSGDLVIVTGFMGGIESMQETSCGGTGVADRPILTKEWQAAEDMAAAIETLSFAPNTPKTVWLMNAIDSAKRFRTACNRGEATPQAGERAQQSLVLKAALRKKNTYVSQDDKVRINRERMHIESNVEMLSDLLRVGDLVEARRLINTTHDRLARLEAIISHYDGVIND